MARNLFKLYNLHARVVNKDDDGNWITVRLDNYFLICPLTIASRTVLEVTAKVPEMIKA